MIYDHWAYRGTITDEVGRNAGSVERSFYPGEDEVHHDYFRLRKEHQGSGFGSDYYRACEQMYRRVGVEKITLLADLEIGGYAWARMGFDFKQEFQRQDRGDWLAVKWANRYGGTWEDYSPQFRKLRAWEMAALTGPDGFRIGKEAMLGTSWDAIKLLRPGSPHRQVGDAYYREKDKRKKKKP